MINYFLKYNKESREKEGFLFLEEFISARYRRTRMRRNNVRHSVRDIPMTILSYSYS